MAHVMVSGAGTAASVMGGMQFPLDGDLGALQTGTSPYSLGWNTRRTSDGTHTLGCTCTDARRRHPNVSVTVSK